MRLSILVPTVPRRLDNLFPRLIRKLETQAARHAGVEILGLYDNKKRSVGAKRNALLDMVAGEYLTFIDDDDNIVDDYVETILNNLIPDTDVLCFGQVVSVNGDAGKLCRYGVDLSYSETADLWTGKPAHTMVWRAALAKQARFPETNFGEDTGWVAQAWPLVDPAKQVRIDKVLYHYNFRDEISETR